MDKLRKICDPKEINIIIFHNPCMDGFASAFVGQLFLDEVKLISKSLDGKPLHP